MAGTDARALASWLAEADDDALTALLRARRIAPGTAWNDFFDAAEALLDPAGIARSAALLDRAAADALTAAVRDDRPVAAGPERDALVAAALVTVDGAAYTSVATTVPTLPRTAPADDAAEDTPDENAGEDDAALAERAFEAIASFADILHLTLRAPLGRTGTGTVGAADRRRLVEAGAVADAEAAADLIAIGEEAGLLHARDRDWRVTAAGADWLRENSVTRWTRVARRLRDTLPPSLRQGDGWLDPGSWPGQHPFDPRWPQRAQRLRDLWRRWGIIDGRRRAAGWADELSRGGEVDAAALEAVLPPEVDRIFLQNDLTAIAPGPLVPAVDARLRRLARRETRAQAATYRFSAETIGAALAAGEDPDDVAAFLGTISLTGLPQPLAYELERAASRHGGLRVGADPSGLTELTANDPALLDTLVVDQALRPLGLIPEAGRLVTRRPVETVFWMLTDARYPAVAVDLDGRPRTIERTLLADESPAVAAVGYDELIGHLRAAHDDDADSAWLGRELDQAVRTRAVLEVTVRLPDASERVFVLEATGLGGGRLRGRDRAADVERTLPVASIVAARPV